MASRQPSSPKPQARQKQRAEGDSARGRASGGGLRSQPAEGSPPPSASTGGRATKSNVRNSLNSRSSNSGQQAHGGANRNK
jgi:hypothetical protein